MYATFVVSATAFVPGNPCVWSNQFPMPTSELMQPSSSCLQATPSLNIDATGSNENVKVEEREIEVPKPHVSTEPSQRRPNKNKRVSGSHKEGVFSPIVLFAKRIIGETELNKIRASTISLHSDVISDFVRKSDSDIGRRLLKVLFEKADKDRNGTIDEDELALALQSAGFDWIKEKQVKGIFKRADVDGNGVIDLGEWMNAAPKTLRTNLIKLAKKNGDRLGMLA